MMMAFEKRRGKKKNTGGNHIGEGKNRGKGKEKNGSAMTISLFNKRRESERYRGITRAGKKEESQTDSGRGGHVAKVEPAQEIGASEADGMRIPKTHHQKRKRLRAGSRGRGVKNIVRQNKQQKILSHGQVSSNGVSRGRRSSMVQKGFWQATPEKFRQAR